MHRGRRDARRPTRPPAAPHLLVLVDLDGDGGPRDALDPTAAFPAVVRVAIVHKATRPAMLFLVKFLYELDLHSAESISWPMLRFAHFKALRIVRRRYPSSAADLAIQDAAG